MPKISIALANRNDGYNDKYYNNLKRLENFFINVEMSLKGIDYEILLLDYNPPKDRDLLSECFPNKKFPKINHVVFSNKDHLEFINAHCNVGAKLFRYKYKEGYNKEYFKNYRKDVKQYKIEMKYKKEEIKYYEEKLKLYKKKEIKYDKDKISYKKIIEFNWFGLLAISLAIKYSTGEYILLATGDTFYHCAFSEFVKKIEPNILYKARFYINNKYKKRKRKNIAKIINKYFELSNKGKSVKDKDLKIFFKYKSKVIKGPGEFILMDKNSWKEVGCFLPLPSPRLFGSDAQILFNAVANGKKIQFVDFPVYNLRSVRTLLYDQLDTMNYIVNYKKLEYDHHKEICSDFFGTKSEVFSKFVDWGNSINWDKNNKSKKYFIELNYKKRFDEIKKIFSFLDKKFLLWE